MLNIIIFGAPGCGKGTQSEKITAKYQLTHLSTGEMLREELSKQTELGKQVELLMSQGHLVPDEIVIKMIRERIELHRDSHGFIFDGFPRTIYQAEILDQLLTEFKQTVSLMISLEVSEEELVSRLILRGAQSGRSDDNEVTIKNRITTYQKNTRPVIDYYQNQNKCHMINGSGTMEEVFDRINQAIKPYDA